MPRIMQVAHRTLIALIALALPATAAARPPPPEPLHFLMLLKQIPLTEAQEAAAVQIRDHMRKLMRSEEKARAADQELVLAELSRAEPNAALLQGAVDREAERLRQSKRALLADFLKVYASFSPEQRRAFTRLARRRVRWHRKHRRRDRPPMECRPAEAPPGGKHHWRGDHPKR